MECQPTGLVHAALVVFRQVHPLADLFHEQVGDVDMGVSKNRCTPKWMVYNEKPIKMDDLGVPLFLETPTW